MASDKPIIAIATGDPAGIGPEISLKAALDPTVRAVCRPILVGDREHPRASRRRLRHRGRAASVARVERCRLGRSRPQCLLDCPQPDAIPLGAISAEAGRASIAFCGAAVKAAMARQVDAVVAAPQNETSIAMAGITFDGHPSFVARETGTREDHVFMMLCFGDTKIAHATLHQSVRQAIDAITRERVARVIDATIRTLKRMGIAAPKIAVSGLNPHAGEGGLFGREEIEIIKPAIDAAAAEGLDVVGPFGADTLFHMPGIDAFIVMLHDQGHIAAKLMARERRRGADHRHADPVFLGRARQRPRHRRQGHRRSEGDDRGGAAAGARRVMLKRMLLELPRRRFLMASTTNVILGAATAILLWTCDRPCGGPRRLSRSFTWVAGRAGAGLGRPQRGDTATVHADRLFADNRCDRDVLAVAAAAYRALAAVRARTPDEPDARVPPGPGSVPFCSRSALPRAILPKFADGAVLLAAPIFDHAKVAMIDEMIRLGLPPGNPFFGEEGQPSRLVYYYLAISVPPRLACLRGSAAGKRMPP